jgi:hypothetical protein
MAWAGGNTNRNAQIATLHARGYSNATLAQTFGLTERHIRRILKNRPGQAAAFFEGTATEKLFDLLEMHDSVVEDAALQAIAADSEGEKIRALDVKLKALDRKKDLLEEYGLMPRFEPPCLDHAGDLGAGVIALMRKHGISTAEIEEELHEVLEAWRTGRLGSHDFTPIEDR